MGKEEQFAFDKQGLKSQLEKMQQGMQNCIQILPHAEIEWSEIRRIFNVELRSKAETFIANLQSEVQVLPKLSFDMFYQQCTEKMKELYRTYELLYHQFYCQVQRASFNTEEIARQCLSII